MTTLVKVKCLNCSLHFIICTEYPKEWEETKPYCPECGSQGSKIIWTETTRQPIFKIVPGTAQIQDIK